MNYNKLPQYIKDNALFCLWKYEQRDTDKPTKVPYQVNGVKAQPDNPNTFTTFETATKAVSKFDGLGIRILGGISAIDIDHCVDGNGKLSDLAEDIISLFEDCYIEKSPSGTGFRILFLTDGFPYDNKKYNINNKSLGLEVYVAGATNKYVTVTGNVFKNGDVIDATDKLKILLDNYMLRNHSPKMNIDVSNAHSYLTDESVISKAMAAKNGDKFTGLWNGDISKYPSSSEADAALCSILAFYCNGEAEQIDKLFRKSKLYRSKWDEMRGADTYGNITINNALGSVNSFYTPIRTSTADEDFNDDLQRLSAFNPANSNVYPWTDIGAGKLFADFYQSTLRYVPERKSWFYFEDGIWSADTGSLKAMLLCMKLANLLHLYALEIKDEHQRKNYMEYSKKWQSYGYRTHILKDAQVHHPISYSAFDKDPYVFNCSNGTLHLDTNRFTEHISTDLLTKISPVTYNPLAESERFTNFISEIMSGDLERAKFLQKILGYGLTGDTRHECMVTLYGASTRNGKGTLCESVLTVLGGYGCTARPETIALKNNSNSQAPSEDIARLAGVRFVNIAEPGKGLVLNAAQVKSMTGNDTLNARFLHENSFDFAPQFKIFINTNYLPVINDMTVFTSGRVIIIPFERHFDESEQDKSLKHEFSKDDAQSAILNWLIEGYNLLRKEGLILPQSVKEATARYQHDSDKLILFMEDCLEHGANYEVRTSDVYYCYKNWCVANGHFAESMKNFKQSLETKATIVRKRPKGGKEKTTMVTGYRLVSEFLQ